VTVIRIWEKTMCTSFMWNWKKSILVDCLSDTFVLRLPQQHD
jgi:hypothetical protein